MRLMEYGTVRLGLAFALVVALAATLAPLPILSEAEAVGPLQAKVKLETVRTGFSLPLLVTHAGDGSGRVFIVEQIGRVFVIDDGVFDPNPWLDIRSKVSCCGEQGLLGLAFHPNFAINGVFFVSYTAGWQSWGTSFLVRYTLDDPLHGRADPNSGVTILTIPQPFGNHNGGDIRFGPDGFLYYAMGDGGAGGDPFNHGQNPNTLLGKMLRLDVNAATYAIPADNPFAKGGGRPEVWALGLRNPWRMSFDRLTGDLWIGDVGQGQWEEVNLQLRTSKGGENYGWNWWEGNHVYKSGAKKDGMTFPIFEYSHAGGNCAVIGGHVYRGLGIPLLFGSYVYGDLCTGKVWASAGALSVWEAPALLIDTPHVITSFGEDEDGNLYLLAINGAIYRFAAA